MVWCLWLAWWTTPAQAADGWLSKIRYALGVSVQAGIGTTSLSEPEIVPVWEGLGLEFRSYFSPRVSSHTTLNLSRMALDAIGPGHARLDYDLHVGFSFARAPGVEAVIAPGASIGYTFDPSPDERFVGDIRLGIDTGRPNGTFSWGTYVRPFVGHRVVTAPDMADGRAGGLHAGVMVELVLLHHFKPRP